MPAAPNLVCNNLVARDFPEPIPPVIPITNYPPPID